MALSKEAPEFDVDDEVLLMEPGIVLEELTEEAELSLSSAKSKNSTTTLKQHKYIDYTRALDATQLYLNEIGFSPLALLTAFLCSTLTGVLFGWLPARNAARLDPVDALARE